jgi:hypothetical protein
MDITTRIEIQEQSQSLGTEIVTNKLKYTSGSMPEYPDSKADLVK